jgi:hypothetical protein
LKMIQQSPLFLGEVHSHILKDHCVHFRAYEAAVSALVLLCKSEWYGDSVQPLEVLRNMTNLVRHSTT